MVKRLWKPILEYYLMPLPKKKTDTLEEIFSVLEKLDKDIQAEDNTLDIHNNIVCVAKRLGVAEAKNALQKLFETETTNTFKTFEEECLAKNRDCQKLVSALLRDDRPLPALVVEKDGCRGIAFLPSCNSSMGPQSGQIFVTWEDGEITAGDFVDDIIADAWEFV